MYEELIKSLRTDHDKYFARDMEAADAIEELDAINQRQLLEIAVLSKPKWIPVTEALPEKDVPVLVYLFGDSPYIAWINHDGEWETEEFTIDRDYLPKTWMPLPEPPKEDT